MGRGAVTKTKERKVGQGSAYPRGGEAPTVSKPRNMEKKCWIPQQKLPRAPPKSLTGLLARLVSAGVNDHGPKTILPVMLGHIMFPFKWWKTGLSKEVTKFF